MTLLFKGCGEFEILAMLMYFTLSELLYSPDDGLLNMQNLQLFVF
jgi:hypothetical protein